MQGRIIKGIGSFYTVMSGGIAYTCRPRGRFREEGISPQVGDYVEFHGGLAEDGYIDAILERRNLLPRPVIANIDRLVWVVSAQLPKADLPLLDKMLVQAGLLGLDAALLINKCDLAQEADIQALEAQFAPAVDTCIRTSAHTGLGEDALRALLGRGTSCLAGQSGAGKSTLMNLLLPERELATGVLSEKTGRGRHTTRHTELLPLGDGFVADTPGFSALEVEALEPEALKDFYPEFRAYADDCRFNGCVHGNEPGCAVREAAEAGGINAARYERYRALLEETRQRWRNRYGKG